MRTYLFNHSHAGIIVILLVLLSSISINILTMVDIAVSEMTTMITTILGVTIPAILGVALGIMNSLNHKSNSGKIHELTKDVGIVKGQYDAVVVPNIGKITESVDLASRLSPELKDAIVKASPTVQAIEAQNAELQKKLAELDAYVKSLDSKAP